MEERLDFSSWYHPWTELTQIFRFADWEILGLVIGFLGLFGLAMTKCKRK